MLSAHHLEIACHMDCWSVAHGARLEICQQDKPESLKCPLNGPASSDEKMDVYSAFLANLVEFRDLNALPTSIRFGDSTSAADFVPNCASCYLCERSVISII